MAAYLARLAASFLFLLSLATAFERPSPLHLREHDSHAPSRGPPPPGPEILSGARDLQESRSSKDTAATGSSSNVTISVTLAPGQVVSDSGPAWFLLVVTPVDGFTVATTDWIGMYVGEGSTVPGSAVHAADKPSNQPFDWFRPLGCNNPSTDKGCNQPACSQSKDDSAVTCRLPIWDMRTDYQVSTARDLGTQVCCGCPVVVCQLLCPCGSFFYCTVASF